MKIGTKSLLWVFFIFCMFITFLTYLSMTPYTRYLHALNNLVLVCGATVLFTLGSCILYTLSNENDIKNDTNIFSIFAIIVLFALSYFFYTQKDIYISESKAKYQELRSLCLSSSFDPYKDVFENNFDVNNLTEEQMKMMGFKCPPKVE